MPKSKPEVFLYPSAWKVLNRLSGAEYRLIVSAIDELEKNPRSSKSKRLQIQDEPMEIGRYRTGHWRINYAVQEIHCLFSLFVEDRRMIIKTWQNY